MTRPTKRKTPTPRTTANDIMHSLREIAQAVHDGHPLTQRFATHTVTIPQPCEYSPAAVKRLRDQLGMSQTAFAQALGVSRIWVQGWERCVR